MMPERDQPGLPTEEARLELTVAAMSAARSNRPRHLVVAGVGLLAIALVYTLLEVGARGAAASEVAQARQDLKNLEQMKQEIVAAQAFGSTDDLKPDRRIVGTLQAMAQASGLPETVTVQEGEPYTKVEGFVQRKYSTKIDDQDPAHVLGWVATVTGEHGVPGLDVAELKLSPGRPLELAGIIGWNLTVTFTRWERKE